MPVTFDLEASEACTQNPSIYAVPYLLRGLNTVGPFEHIPLGSDVPDLERPEEFLIAVQKGLHTVRQRRELIAVDVFNLCNQDHSLRPKAGRRGPHRLERYGSLVMAHEYARPVPVSPQKSKNGIELHVAEPSKSTGPVSPVVFPDRTKQEGVKYPVSHIVRSLPYGQAFDRAFAALDGREIIYTPHRSRTYRLPELLTLYNTHPSS